MKLFFKYSKGMKYIPFLFSLLLLILLGISTTRHTAYAKSPQIREARTSVAEIQNKENYFSSSIISLDFPANIIGFSWPKELESYQNEDDFLQIKYLEKRKENSLNFSQWSEWQAVLPGEIPSQKEPEKIFSEPIFIPSNIENTEKIILRSRVKNILEKVEIIFIDSTPVNSVINFQQQNSSNSSIQHAMPLKIISRAEWGADESYRFDSSGAEIWPIEYADVKKIVLHETDGYNGGDNPAATVRGIYHWHAKTLGWGDVGYNYLIDQYGNIYEGRYGGDGAVAGHVYYDYTDKENKIRVGYNMNIGSMGISILGTYNSDEPTGSMQTALANLLYQKALDFGLEPTGAEDNWTFPIKITKQTMSESQSWEIVEKAITNSSALFRVKGIDYEFNFLDQNNPLVRLKNVPTFTRHKDIDYKSDPQENLDLTFLNSRTLASQMYSKKLAEGIKQKAVLLSQNASTIKLREGEAAEFSVRFRNEGETTWHNYSAQKISVSSSLVKSRLAQLGGYRFALAGSDASSIASYRLDKANVQPGEEVTATWQISASKNRAKEDMEYVLTMGELGYFPDTEVKISVINTDLAGKDYATEFISQSLPVAIFDNHGKSITVQYKNIGKKTWKRGEIKLYLKNKDAENEISPLKNALWKGNFGIFDFEEEEVNTDMIATFQIPIQSISSAGMLRQKFYLTRLVKMEGTDIILGEEKVFGGDLEFQVRIDPVYSAKIASSTTPLLLSPRKKQKSEIELKNNGLASWKGNVQLINNYRPKDAKNSFWGNDWKSYEVIQSKKANIKPGESIKFSFSLDAPQKEGEYNFQYSVKIGDKLIVVDGLKELAHPIVVAKKK